MTSRWKKYALLAVYIFIRAATVFSEENNEKFDTLFSLAVSSKYNHLQFLYDDNMNAVSNKPVDIGFNLTYKNLSLGIGIGVPFTNSNEYQKSTAFDIKLKYYNDFIFGEASFRYYDGFHSDTSPVDLELLSGGLMVEYILNRDHLLRSVYKLDRLQTVTNGSFLFGSNAFITSLLSNDIHSYMDKTQYIYFGPNIGYSYTWILGNNYFINIFLVVGTDLCIKYNTKQYFLTPQVMSKFSAGKHNSSWSVNFELDMDYVSYSEKFNFRDALLSESACITISKRF
jgi:hypothetical protein